MSSKYCEHCGQSLWDAFAYAWLEVAWFIAYGEERGACAHRFLGKCAHGCGSLAHPDSKRGFCWTHHVEYPLERPPLTRCATDAHHGRESCGH